MRRKSTLLVTAFAVALGASVAAQGQGQGPGQGPGPGMGMDHGMMMGQGPGMQMGPGMMGMGGGDDKSQSFAEGRVAFLRAELAITSAQDGVWTAYADAVRKNLANMQVMHARMRDMMSATTPVARLDAHVAAMEGRLGALKEMRPALAALYDALSDEQKKKADALLTGMGCMM
jgi:hypothetical protein